MRPEIGVVLREPRLGVAESAGHAHPRALRADSNSEIVLFSAEIEHIAVDHMLAKTAMA